MRKFMKRCGGNMSSLKSARLTSSEVLSRTNVAIPDVASMNAEAVNRSVEVQYASAADISRVEIRKLPLPQDSSNAIGGTINLVPVDYVARAITALAADYTSTGVHHLVGDEKRDWSRLLPDFVDCPAAGLQRLPIRAWLSMPVGVVSLAAVALVAVGRPRPTSGRARSRCKTLVSATHRARHLRCNGGRSPRAR